MTDPAAPPFVVDEKIEEAIARVRMRRDHGGRDIDVQAVLAALDHTRAALAAAEQERDDRDTYLITCPYCGQNRQGEHAAQTISHVIGCADHQISSERVQLTAATERAEKAEEKLKLTEAQRDTARAIIARDLPTIRANAEQERWLRLADLYAVADERDALKICHVCKRPTDTACSDCRIDFGTSIYVCSTECLEVHERKCSAEQAKRLAAATERAEKADEGLRAEREIRNRLARECADLHDRAISVDQREREVERKIHEAETARDGAIGQVGQLEEQLAATEQDRDHYRNLYEHLAMRRECADAVDALKAQCAAAEQREQELLELIRAASVAVEPDQFPLITKRLHAALAAAPGQGEGKSDG